MYSRIALSTRTQTTALSRAAASRQFHASPAAFKTVTETVKEKADAVNKKLGKGLASAIESGEVATEKTKQATGVASEKTSDAAGVAKEKTKETAGVAGQKKNEAKAEIKKDL
ncbi:uncharacterized protein STEHIDRAFT_136015 [Stereum hirsutum FP-91666 SS1]|uniref:uncharacterized protein n=1 Tax=Stereum hirsutum (strain FP-91666) TaxID=721885 RepID=UPI000440C6B1|nr:uncharacterized protein STEHIDRAFT_136015 [Stereum hirsutum FP-91666 SS1]EIM91894.1 hypothetical protein STEHIDRAFT_136015 [Stereum hirsutum FP-91666 SS1]